MKKCLTLLVLLTSFMSNYLHGYQENYQDPKEDRGIFQQLYQGDATKIVNFYSVKNLDYIYTSYTSMLKSIPKENFSMPGDHVENCKRFFLRARHVR